MSWSAAHRRESPSLRFIYSLCRVGLLAIVSCAQPRGGTGHLLWSKTVWNMGTFEASTVLRHTFTFRNSSDRVIRVLDVIGSCGCVAISGQRASVPPGRWGAIVVAIEPDGRQYYEEAITVTTDESGGHRYKLRVIGRQRLAVVTDPAELSLGIIRAGERVEVPLVISVLEDTYFTGASCSPGIGIVPGPLVGLVRKGKRRLLVHVRPGLPFGQIDGTLRLYTRHKFQSLIEIPVFGRLVGKVNVYPEIVLLGRSQASDRSCTVRIEFPRTWQIYRSGIHAPSSCTVSRFQQPKAGIAELTLAMRPGTTARSSPEHLLVRFRSGVCVQVPVYIE